MKVGPRMPSSYQHSFNSVGKMNSPKDTLEDDIKKESTKICLDSKPHHIQDTANTDGN